MTTKIEKIKEFINNTKKDYKKKKQEIIKKPITVVFTFILLVIAITNINTTAEPKEQTVYTHNPDSVRLYVENPVEITPEPLFEIIEEYVEETPQEETKEQEINSKYLEKWFYNKTGQMHMDTCLSTPTGRKFVDAFAEYGQDAQVIACVTLNHENGIVGGDYITDAVSPCWSTNTQQAKTRTCEYASDNSKGVDAGLFMINTYYQAKRITKLGGEACTFIDSRDTKDPCNQVKIAWLHNIDNQIKIIKDIYNEQGFEPWVAYKKNVKPYL